MSRFDAIEILQLGEFKLRIELNETDDVELTFCGDSGEKVTWRVPLYEQHLDDIIEAIQLLRMREVKP